jgi:predicted negative regulator of RcsB-dependent stress response
MKVGTIVKLVVAVLVLILGIVVIYTLDNNFKMRQEAEAHALEEVDRVINDPLREMAEKNRLLRSQGTLTDSAQSAAKGSSNACSFDEIKTPPLIVFSDDDIESTEGNEIKLFIDYNTKDSILAMTIYGEMGKGTYKFVFNGTLKDAEQTNCWYGGTPEDATSWMVEKKTLKTSKDAEKELREMFASTQNAMYKELRKSSANSGNGAAEYISNGMKYLESGDNNRRPADYDLAVAEFDKAIRLSQNNAEAYYGRGRAYLRKGDNSRAVADYTQAIRLNPNDVISYSNRGRAYARMGDYDNAVSDFESAQRIDPNNEAIKQNLEKARRQDKGL